jgi:hypothetical protein
MSTRRLDRSPKLKDPLRVMSCGHCQRLIDFMDSPGHVPPGTDPALLHPIFLPHPPRYSVVCTCGHYTFYVDDAEREKYEAQHPAPPAAPESSNGEVSEGARARESSDA